MLICVLGRIFSRCSAILADYYIESAFVAGVIQCYYRKIAEYYSELLVAVTRYIQK